ncbi:MAG: carbon-nitrogen hydrolase family protein [Myxococcales bacterium]|nr:carbon-nitrogen hydrolase family protein [Myxococcales bacterium]
MRDVHVGIVQLTTSSDARASGEAATGAIRSAARAGATIMTLPENTVFMGGETEKRREASTRDAGWFVHFSDLARELESYLAIGSLPEAIPGSERVYNTSVLYGPDGAELAAYRKIHLFDVGDLGDGVVYRESAAADPGDAACLVDLPFGKVGLSICFDLRFPGLFESLADAGAEILLIPSAFTVPTGRAHWHTLVRARAIETQCWVIAAAQTGQNLPSRATHGHSLIVDPWGEVVADLGAGEGFEVHLLTAQKLEQARERVPTRRNRRAFRAPSGS